MTKTKKFLAILLAAMFILSMSAITTSASADDTTGRIRIMNAIPNVEYDLFKFFDVTYSETVKAGVTTKNYSYTTKNADLIAAIKAETKMGIIECPYQVDSEVVDGDGNTVAAVSAKSGFTDGKGRGWAWAYIKSKGTAANHYTDAADFYIDVTDNKLDEGEGNVLNLGNQAYGYYLVHREDSVTGEVISVDTNTPNVDMYDKNPANPSDVDKSVDKILYEVGEEAEFTVSFLAVNTAVNGLSDVKQVTEYFVKDITATGVVLPDDPEWTVELYSDKALTDELTDYTFEDLADNASAAYSFSWDATTDRLTLKWANATPEGETKYTSIYPSPVYVKITYKGLITEQILAANGYDELMSDSTKINPNFQGKNTAKVYYYNYDMKTDKSNKPETPGDPDDPSDPDNPTKVGQDDVTVYTVGVSIRKYNQSNEALSGAQFRLYKMDGTAKKYYKWDNKTAADKTDGVVTWIADADDATVSTADNVTLTAEFAGLGAGTYYLEEIKAPTGYSVPKDPYVLTIAATGRNTDSTPVFTLSDGTTTATDTYLTQNNTDDKHEQILTRTVINYSGTELPSTGGTGTTIFYVVGSILLVGAAILLVTKKRMSIKE